MSHLSAQSGVVTDELLIATGTMVASNCGDPLSYQGYDYATVLIGEQCWFAENLRAEHYANGDAIPGQLKDSQWKSTTSGAVTVYGEGTSTGGVIRPGMYDGSYDEESNLSDYGRLYNWYAVDDARGLCPTGWHVPTGPEYTELTDFLGGLSIAGTQMKSSPSDDPSWSGTNTSGFSALAGGYRDYNGNFLYEGRHGYFWSDWRLVNDRYYASYLRLDSRFAEADRDYDLLRYGFSVRCVRDAE
jgi:uncharacterized protein (TIGR02145 family)